jgi:type II secretory pathway component PulF
LCLCGCVIVTPGQLNRRAELYHQLGTTIAAGVPLMKALEMASATPSVRASRKTFLELIGHLQSGLTFSDSMARVHGWLPEFDIALLSVGESSGRLDVSFILLANYYATRATIIRDALNDLAMTIVTLHVFFLIFPLGYLISFVLGIVNNDHARCWPFIIEKIVVFGSLYGIGLFLVFACQGQRGERWRSLVESLLRPVPLLGTARTYLVFSRLTAALEALTAAGVSIVKSWEIAATASGSPSLQREIAGWKPRLESGATPADLINRSGHFPPIFANLYTTAEQSGKLDEALTRLHGYFHDEGFRILRTFTRVLNGLIYTAVVITVAVFVIRFYVGYFHQAMNAAGGF